MEKRFISLFIAIVFVCNAQNKIDSNSIQVKDNVEWLRQDSTRKALVRKADDAYLKDVAIILEHWKKGKEISLYDINDTSIYQWEGALFSKFAWLPIRAGLHYQGNYYNQVWELKAIENIDTANELKKQAPKMVVYCVGSEDNIFKCYIDFNQVDENELQGLEPERISNQYFNSNELIALQQWFQKKIGRGKKHGTVMTWDTKEYVITVAMSGIQLGRPQLSNEGYRCKYISERLYPLEEGMFNEAEFKGYSFPQWMEMYFKNYGKINGYQEYKWFSDYKKLKSKIGGNLTDQNSRKVLSKETIVAGMPAYSNYEFINDRLQAVSFAFGKKESDNSGNEYLDIRLDAKEADVIFNDLKNMLLDKYGICVRKNDDGSSRWGENWYKWGDEKREKEIVWNLGTTIIVLSMDSQVDDDKKSIYSIKVWYFEPNYINNRETKKRDEL